MTRQSLETYPGVIPTPSSIAPPSCHVLENTLLGWLGWWTG